MRRTRTNDYCLIVNQIEIRFFLFSGRFQTDFIGYLVTIRALCIHTFVFYRLG